MGLLTGPISKNIVQTMAARVQKKRAKHRPWTLADVNDSKPGTFKWNLAIMEDIRVAKSLDPELFYPLTKIQIAFSCQLIC
jgi:hypothetical protein